MTKIILIFGSILLLSACASKPTLPVFSERFITSINDEGMKQFDYEVTLGTMDEMRRSGPSGGRRGGASPRDGGRGMGGPGDGGGMTPTSVKRRQMSRDPDAAIAERLDKVVAESGFCQNGYFIIRKNIQRGGGTVFGECKAMEHD